MKAEDAVRRAVSVFTEVIRLPVDAVVGVSHDEHGWVVSLEAIHRTAIPDTMDILGLYEIRLSDTGDLVDVSRKLLRKRGQTDDRE